MHANVYFALRSKQLVQAQGQHGSLIVKSISILLYVISVMHIHLYLSGLFAFIDKCEY